jgi:YhcH/YjgK/YiaL family protein
MIIDNVTNASKYFCMHPKFKDAFEFISQKKDFLDLKETKFQIKENLKGFTEEFIGQSVRKENLKMECHIKNIDIQYCISGSEVFGWKSKSDCKMVLEKYDQEKDIQFFTESADILFTLQPGQFVIFFPDDVHAPGMNPNQIKKLVLKVTI